MDSNSADTFGAWKLYTGDSNRTVVNEQKDCSTHVVEPEDFSFPEDIVRRKKKPMKYMNKEITG